MKRPIRLASPLVGALALVGASVAAQVGRAAEEEPVIETAPFSEAEALERVAPRTRLDWRALEDLDAQTYVERLATLDRLAMEASQLALERNPRQRTADVARDILEAHRAGRAMAEQMLPESDADATPSAQDAETLAALRDAPRLIVFEETYIDAMIEAHREATALTSFYRRFGSDQDVREFARRILPLLEASLYQAVAIRQELVAEFIAAAQEGEDG